MVKTCIRLSGTAGLLLVNHHGEHLHRLALLTQLSSELLRPRRFLSGIKEAEVTRQGSNVP